MNHIHIQYFKHRFAEFILGSYQGKLCLCDFRYRRLRSAVDKRLCKGLQATFTEQDDSTLSLAKEQLNDYFAGVRKVFDLHLLLVGSDFQKAVWQALMTIPYGNTSTYAELAKKINNPQAIRAVGTANGANALSVIIPCHRVIGTSGELIGYGGGVNLKKRLINLEKRRSDFDTSNQ